MKSVFKFMTRSAIVFAVGFSISASAGQVGVVDMQSVFQTAPQVKKINDNLTSQFQDRKNKIVQMGEQLKADIKKYQKNKAVMSKNDLSSLETKITDEEAQLRQEQTKFQQDVYQAQNQQMAQFLEQVKGVVKTIAGQKKLEMVLPKNTVLYSQDGLDITSDVLANLK
jgi:outer membrane protein